MARIRSVHPGLFTDESFVALSPLARLLAIGLWTEADDKGCFEWKPLQIKMRLLAGDNTDAATLLAELQSADLIRHYEMDGRQYGAIRNFRKYQRPKTPNDVYPLPKHFRNYVGLTDDISEPFPPKGEKSPQMEDGGGRKKEEEGKEERKEESARDARRPDPPPFVEPLPAEPSRKAAEPRATRLPADFRPPPEWLDFAVSEGFSESEADRELEKFRDYWTAQPGAKGRKLDWPATWRNWIRRAGETRERAAPNRSAGVVESLRRVVDWARDMDDRNGVESVAGYDAEPEPGRPQIRLVGS